MKIAVLSDIHGNNTALEAVLEDAKRENTGAFIIAGDHIGDGPNPGQVVRTIRSLPNCWAIKGNKEEKILDYSKGKHPDWTDSHQTACFVWTSRQLSDADIEYLDNLPIQTSVKIDALPGIRVVHGSPEKADDKLIVDDNADRVFEILNTIEECALVFGHSHLDCILQHHFKLAVNPGSVGLPYNEGGLAEYGLLEWTDGKWNYRQKFIEYDKAALIKEFQDSGLLQAGGAWAKLTLKSICEGRDFNGGFLREAYQLTRASGAASRLVPNDIWEELDAKWNWV